MKWNPQKTASSSCPIYCYLLQERKNQFYSAMCVFTAARMCQGGTQLNEAKCIPWNIVVLSY